MDEKNKKISDEEDIKSSEEEKPEKETHAKPDKSEKKKKHETDAALLKAQEEIKKLSAEVKEQDERYLRILAEYDNFKKRSAKEKEEIAGFARGEMLRELLPVFDNLDRSKGVEDAEKLKEGITMILSSFEAALGKLGITEISALGEQFDPNLHEAIFHEDKEGEPENTISEVFQKGYMSGDKVIRHAMVKVIN